MIQLYLLLCFLVQLLRLLYLLICLTFNLELLASQLLLHIQVVVDNQEVA